jgi:hypothetical protein
MSDPEPPAAGVRALPALGASPIGAAAAPTPHVPASDDLVWDAPAWVLPAGLVLVVGLIGACFVIFWQGMGTEPRQAAVEAFGVAFGLLTVVSAVGAFHRAARHDPRPVTPRDASE